MRRWLLAHPLLVCLPVQAALLLHRLSALPMWGDEDASLARAALSSDALIVALRDNVHPPLYALLLGGWLALPWEAPALLRARALSALLVLLATVVLTRTWLHGLAPRTRAWFLAVWTLSPALLLYGRMARSYSLQLLLGPLALWLGWRCLQQPGVGAALAYATAAALLLYTHYLPGLAVLAAVALLATWRLLTRREARWLVPLLVPPLAIALASLAWLPLLGAAVRRVGAAAAPVVFGHPVLDAGAALAFTAVSFTVGEMLRPWMATLAAPLAAGIALLLWRAARRPPPWAALLLLTAMVATAGALQWVSVAFVAGRLLFLLPFLLLLLVDGGAQMPRLRAAVCLGLLCMSLAATQAYFARAGFLNKAYVIPMRAIARTIRAHTQGAPRLVLDHHSTNLTPLRRYLPRRAQVLFVVDEASAATAAALADAPGGRPVWLVRAAHDSSPAGLSARVEAAWAARCPLGRRRFVRYGAIDHALMAVAGWPQRPTHAIELVALRCPPGGAPQQR